MLFQCTKIYLTYTNVELLALKIIIVHFLNAISLKCCRNPFKSLLLNLQVNKSGSVCSLDMASANFIF